MADTAPKFSDQTITFLRALKRHNRREWFNAHKDEYEQHVRQPMAAMVERLAEDFRGFAPELVASPRLSMYRIYRDTRFSENKTPYKTHVAAVFPTRGLLKHEGAGLYFHISPDEVWIGGGMYAPQPAQLYAVREHIAGHFGELRAIVESSGFRRHVGKLEGEKLIRVPRGFAKDHPAAEYLKHRHFLAGAEFPPSLAAGAKLHDTLLKVFRQVIPLSRFLNTPLLAPSTSSRLAPPTSARLAR
jgi:uncharacterized protein (TIGR02453 family)